MRKVLLIAYHYPPEPAAGARRPGFLARYLPEFGWDATVLTRPLPLRSGKRDDVEQPGIIAAPLPGASLGKRVRSAIVADNGSAPSPQPSTMRWFLRRARETLMFPDNAAPWLPGAIAAGVRACDAIG
ncbi:MAG TPA: hypothetical protein VMF61_01710, partial [Candidatus Acidoferrales bacterium]|nr:hypothetical protein [Candidatus Acidoferrales bacterium]